jgi:hypothetical protein
MGENFPVNEEDFEIPEARPEGVKKVFDEAVGYLNMSRAPSHVGPSETKKEVEERKEWYRIIFIVYIGNLEKMYPCGNWEQRAREEADKRFPGST